MVRLDRGAAGALCLLLAVGGCASSRPPIAGVEEASGVVRQGDRLLLVGDDEAGTYYSYPLDAGADGRIALDPSRLTAHRLDAGAYANDLEAIDVLGDGRVIVLSEELFALLDADGAVVRYDRSLAGFGGRGLEGLAIRAREDGSSSVAVVWEGGYPGRSQLAPDVWKRVAGHALQPRLLVHDLAAGERGVVVHLADARTVVELVPPHPAGKEPYAQRFRAPDLVWHQWPIDGTLQWGFIVLLSSGWAVEPEPGAEAECPKAEDGAALRWCYRWLQRFTLDGLPWGEPFDLESVLPVATRTSNWEGMGWFVPGESLVLVYDERLAHRRLDPQEALVVPLPEGW